MTDETNAAPAGDEIDYPVGLTARGRAVLAGRNALAVNGDDTLTADTEPSQVSGEQTPAVEDESAGAPDPGAGTPTKETAVAVVAGDRETRTDEEA